MRYGKVMSASQHTVLIAGATASGKSALALRLAEAVGGVVVNADAMQVYRELPILTARPTAQDQARAPHRLYGHVSASEPYSVGRWLADAKTAIAAAHDAGQMPILVGGTGLYFKVLLEGLSPIPDFPVDVRTHWRNEASRLGATALHAELARRDPEMAGRLAPTDLQRLTRALEVLEGTGRSLAHWQRQPGVPVLRESDTVRIVISFDRVGLVVRCDTRFDAMLSAGALAEVRALLELQLDPKAPAMGALGVAALAAHLRGQIDLPAAVERAKRDTRHYVKRQQTWLRRNMVSWNNVQTLDMERNDRSIDALIDLLRRNA